MACSTLIQLDGCSFEMATAENRVFFHNGYNSQNENRVLNRPHKTES